MRGSLYALGPFPRYMHELHSDESERLLALFKNTVYENHYLTVRFKWRNSNDLGTLVCLESRRPDANTLQAIWDDRSTFHTATYDYDGLGDRFGNRAVGIGEAPDIDPDSKTRREALSEP